MLGRQNGQIPQGLVVWQITGLSPGVKIGIGQMRNLIKQVFCGCRPPANSNIAVYVSIIDPPASLARSAIARRLRPSVYPSGVINPATRPEIHS